MQTYTAIVEYDTEVKSFSGIVEGLHGAHTQGNTLEELESNLREVIELVTERCEQLKISLFFKGIYTE